MPLEYEYQFYEYDKSTIIKSIKKIGFKNKGQFIFRIMLFTHPLNTPGTYIRIRDEGYRITLTYKTKDPKSNFENEDEVLIDNFDNGVNILFGLGCKKKFYYEKIREIWSENDNEIVFDINPGAPERMEIETSNKKDLDALTKHLQLTDLIVEKGYKSLKELFGVVLDSNQDLTFLNAKKVLSKLVTKNKTKFKKIINDQLILYNKLIK
jgi:predicted adenylyl cyclase CyaB